MCQCCIHTNSVSRCSSYGTDLMSLSEEFGESLMANSIVDTLLSQTLSKMNSAFVDAESTLPLLSHGSHPNLEREKGTKNASHAEPIWTCRTVTGPFDSAPIVPLWNCVPQTNHFLYFRHSHILQRWNWKGRRRHCGYLQKQTILPSRDFLSHCHASAVEMSAIFYVSACLLNLVYVVLPRPLHY